MWYNFYYNTGSGTQIKYIPKDEIIGIVEDKVSIGKVELQKEVSGVLTKQKIVQGIIEEPEE